MISGNCSRNFVFFIMHVPGSWLCREWPELTGGDMLLIYATFRSGSQTF